MNPLAKFPSRFVRKPAAKKTQHGWITIVLYIKFVTLSDKMDLLSEFYCFTCQ